ncbi:MAG: hypothetical protein U5Q03_02650 [Bacteroidota bacterium]|nr:hypothetical protein [Bacteroidota bacterium]
MKLDSCGLDGYNIKRVDYESFTLDRKSEITEIMLAPEADTGRLLKNMYARGRDYYDNKLYNNSPALPFLIMLSQKTIGSGNGYFVSSTFIGKNLKSKNPKPYSMRSYTGLSFRLFLVCCLCCLHFRLAGSFLEMPPV